MQLTYISVEIKFGGAKSDVRYSLSMVFITILALHSVAITAPRDAAILLLKIHIWLPHNLIHFYRIFPS